MAFFRALTSASGGGGLPDFEVIGFFETDRSISVTIPSGVDFLLVGAFWIQPKDDNIYRKWITFPDEVNEQFGIIKNVGDSVTQTKTYGTYNSNLSTTNQVTTWTNATTVTVTKPDYNNGAFIMACKYKS